MNKGMHGSSWETPHLCNKPFKPEDFFIEYIELTGKVKQAPDSIPGFKRKLAAGGCLRLSRTFSGTRKFDRYGQPGYFLLKESNNPKSGIVLPYP